MILCVCVCMWQRMRLFVCLFVCLFVRSVGRSVGCWLVWISLYPDLTDQLEGVRQADDRGACAVGQISDVGPASFLRVPCFWVVYRETPCFGGSPPCLGLFWVGKPHLFFLGGSPKQEEPGNPKANQPHSPWHVDPVVFRPKGPKANQDLSCSQLGNQPQNR